MAYYLSFKRLSTKSLMLYIPTMNQAMASVQSLAISDVAIHPIDVIDANALSVFIFSS